MLYSKDVNETLRLYFEEIQKILKVTSIDIESKEFISEKQRYTLEEAGDIVKRYLISTTGYPLKECLWNIKAEKDISVTFVITKMNMLFDKGLN